MLQSVVTPNSSLDPDKSYEGYLEISHTAELVDASFSADGTAIAIASADGFVKFFQVSSKRDVTYLLLHKQISISIFKFSAIH